MYIYIYTYIHTKTRSAIQTANNTTRHIHISVRIYVYAYIYMCTCIHVCTYMYIYIHIPRHTTPYRSPKIPQAACWHKGRHCFRYYVVSYLIWHNLFICATWRIHVCSVTHMCNMTHTCDVATYKCDKINCCWHTGRHSFWNDVVSCLIWHDSFICATWLIYMCDMIHMRDMAHRCNMAVYKCDKIHCCWHKGPHSFWNDVVSYLMWHDSFKCATWLIHICDKIHMRNMTHTCDMAVYKCDKIHCCWHKDRHCFWNSVDSYLTWHDSFICATWLIHMCDMIHMILLTQGPTLFLKLCGFEPDVTWLIH